MNLPNQYFQDYPIAFKEINPIDFPDFIIENNKEKIVIVPNEDGYITTQLEENINIAQKNTVVVNAAVGQGKTTAIINIISKLYNDKEEDYLIFVASPFVSLVEQYYKEISKVGVPSKDIYRYEYIGEKPNIKYINKKVHILTVNGLLGNPGDDAFINSEAKRIYLNSLANSCKKQGRKVVIIMDEIHDAIANFKEEYIFNLWKWKGVLHKNIILSATYNEASKIVIEYLAELTDDRIKIIESERKRILKNQSELYLHYNPALYYKSNNEQIVTVVSDLIARGKEVDILCFSKALADSITENKDEGVGRVLYTKYDEINNCTTVLKNNQRLGRLEVVKHNRFDNDKCNVGTNFKTGISITKRNHAFVIIMPPKGSKLPFKNAYGVFSDGINSVIQALARQRKRGGEIHIILPLPEEFNYDTLPFEGNMKSQFIKFYDSIKDASKVSEQVKYVPYNLQNMLIRNFYEGVLKDNVEKEINLVYNTDRNGKLSLRFPEFKSYLLDKGEGYLANTYKFLGKDLSSYITYSAVTNQFVNCNFSGYTSKPPLKFKEGEFQMTMDFFYEMYLSEDRYFVQNNSTDFYRYMELKIDLIKNYKLSFFKEGKSTAIKPQKDKEFEIQLLGFVARKLYPSYTSKFYIDGALIDYEFSRRDYFLSNISHALKMDLGHYENDTRTLNRISAYRSLNYFREKLLTLIEQSNKARRGNFEYVLTTPQVGFVANGEQERFNNMLDYLVNEDYFIASNIFEFKQRFKSSFSTRQKECSFYTKLVEDFLDTEEDKLSTTPRRNVKVVLRVVDLPDSSTVIDLISPADLTFSDAFWASNTYDVIDGKLVKSNPS